MPIVTFIRHAETVYNDNKIFAGRIDCELSKKRNTRYNKMTLIKLIF